MQVVLVMFRSDGERRSFSIVRDMTVIGRREDCDLRIPLGDVSRKHCRLIKDGDVVRVEDLGSSNGTYRNGQRIQQSELAPGDTLQVGPVVFVLQVDGVPADDALQPVTSGAVGGAGGEPEEELEVVDEGGGQPGEPGEFDPMEALNAAEGSGFEFHMEEEAAAAAAAAEVANDDSDIVDMGEAGDAGASVEQEEAALDLEEASAEADDAPMELDALEEGSAGLDEIVDLEESEEKK